MNIKILGAGCPNCQTLEKRVRRVVEKHKIEAEISKVEEITDIISYGVMVTPALVINEVVVSKGRLPKEQEILEFIKN